MGEYELLIFLTEDRIYVMEVDLEGQTKRVGFQGEEYFHYESIEDIDGFYNNLTETYNVDCLTELDSRIYIIECGVDKEFKWCLLDKLRPIEVLNFIDITNLVPILLSKKGMLKVGEQVVVEFLGKKYAYICDNDYRIGELTIRGKKAQQALKLEEFAFIAVWEGNLSQGNIDKQLQLEERVKELESELESQKQTYEENLKKYEDKTKYWEEKYNSIEQKMQKIIKDNNETITQEIISNRRLVKAVIYENWKIIKQNITSGTVVKLNQKIGGFLSNRSTSSLGYEIYAPRAGKLVWLSLDGDELKPGNNRIVGVVGDESDDPKDMFEWLKKEAKN